MSLFNGKIINTYLGNHIFIYDWCFFFYEVANSNTEAQGHWGFYWHTSKKSKELTELMTQNASAILPNKSRGITSLEPNNCTNFVMCRSTTAPFVLFEFAFFANSKELELLKA